MFGDGFKSDLKQFGRKLVFSRFFCQKAWTNPLGFWSKFQICSNFLYR